MGLETLPEDAGRETYSHTVEEFAGAPVQESARTALVSRLRDPGKNSPSANLKNIAGAFFLSGLVLFPGTVDAAKGLQKTAEYQAMEKAQSFSEIQRKNPEIYKRIVDAIRKRGGIPIYPGQEIVEKSQKIGQFTRDITVGHPNPYFLTPQHVLGEGFPKKHPEKADRYMKRIEKALNATVTVMSDKGSFASGVIVKTKEGAAILTSAHAVRDQEEVTVQFINGIAQLAKVTKWDSENDLALLDIKLFKNNSEQTYFSQKEVAAGAKASGFEILELDNNPVFKEGEKIGLAGNPLRYPWETHICEYKTWMDARAHTQSPRYTFKGHVLKQSPEFRSLARYVQEPAKKGGIKESYSNSRLIPGMSGGPAFRLDETGDNTKLAGINAWSRFKNKKGDWELDPVIISASEIKKFLEK